MVSLFHTEPNYIATIINTFSNALFRRTQSTLGAIVWLYALVFFSEEVWSTKVSFTVVEVTALGTEKGGTTWAECLKHTKLQQLCLKGLLETAVCGALVIMHHFKYFGITIAITLTY